MLCEKCKKNEASVFFSEVKNGEKMKHSLCEQCVQKQSELINEPSFSYSIQSIIGQFIESIAAKTDNKESKVICNLCGISYAQFRKQGRFGCENDYQVFRKMLIGIFSQLHGASRHNGKTPASFVRKRELLEKIENLQKKLDKAIRQERYEDAAGLRDKIHMLKGEGHEYR